MSNPHAHSLTASNPSGTVRPVTKDSANDLPGGVPHAIVCGTPGTVNFVDCTDFTVNGFPLQQGYNPICPRRILTGGTAADIWALYL